MRRAIAVVRKRHALTGRALASRRAALERVAVDVEAVLRLAGEPLLRELQVPGDGEADARLLRHREMHPDVVEQRARRTLEVMAIGGEALYGRFARTQHRSVRLDPAWRRVFRDVRRQVPVDRSRELVH